MEDNFQHKNNIIYRISQIAENEAMSITALETLIGASKGVLSRALKQNSDIQSKWIQKIIAKFPQYSSNWLITGEGEMYENFKLKGLYISGVTANPIEIDFTDESYKTNPYLTALIKIGNKYYSANRLSELEEIVKKIKKI